jgi:hypothetical protein
MKTNRLFWWTPFVVLALVVFASAFLPALAQDEDDAEEAGLGDLYAEIEAWVAQPAGLDYFPATETDPQDPFNTQLLTFPTGTSTELRYRAGFELSGNRGGFILTWFAHEDRGEMTRATPGDYVFGETLVHPFLAGYHNDGLADGFDATASTDLSDLRIDYYRTAFKTASVEAKWFVGWRRVSHRRTVEASYFGLIDDLPPLTSRPDLAPGVDTAYMDSNFDGRGVGAGMDFLMPLWQDKISFEGGFNLAVLRSKTDAVYRSTTYAYTIFIDPDTLILEPPYDFDGTVNDVPAIDLIAQEAYEIGLVANNVSSTGNVLEGYVGLRWKAWRGLDVYGGFRSTRYDDVGVDLRPKGNSLYAGVNVQDITEVDRSATYEGFYAGLAYRF